MLEVIRRHAHIDHADFINNDRPHAYARHSSFEPSDCEFHDCKSDVESDALVEEASEGEAGCRVRRSKTSPDQGGEELGKVRRTKRGTSALALLRVALVAGAASLAPRVADTLAFGGECGSVPPAAGETRCPSNSFPRFDRAARQDGLRSGFLRGYKGGGITGDWKDCQECDEFVQGGSERSSRATRLDKPSDLLEIIGSRTSRRASKDKGRADQACTRIGVEGLRGHEGRRVENTLQGRASGIQRPGQDPGGASSNTSSRQGATSSDTSQCPGSSGIGLSHPDLGLFRGGLLHNERGRVDGAGDANPRALTSSLNLKSLRNGHRVQIKNSVATVLNDATRIPVNVNEVREALRQSQQLEYSDIMSCNNTSTSSNNFNSCNKAQLDSPFIMEVFTDTEPVATEAARRGHNVGASKTLKLGYDFYRKSDRDRALREIDTEKPFMAVIAFPCSPWSNLMNLNPGPHVERLRRRDRLLVNFAVEVARRQLAAGRHFVVENPNSSAAWRIVASLRKLAQDRRVFWCRFDQCMFGLRGVSGNLHKKGTVVLTSCEHV